MKTRAETLMARAARLKGREGDPVEHAMRVTGLSRSEILAKLAAAAKARHPELAAKYAGTIKEMEAAAARLKEEGK